MEKGSCIGIKYAAKREKQNNRDSKNLANDETSEPGRDRKESHRMMCNGIASFERYHVPGS